MWAHQTCKSMPSERDIQVILGQASWKSLNLAASCCLFLMTQIEAQPLPLATLLYLGRRRAWSPKETSTVLHGWNKYHSQGVWNIQLKICGYIWLTKEDEFHHISSSRCSLHTNTAHTCTVASNVLGRTCTTRNWSDLASSYSNFNPSQIPGKDLDYTWELYSVKKKPTPVSHSKHQFQPKPASRPNLRPQPAGEARQTFRKAGIAKDHSTVILSLSTTFCFLVSRLVPPNVATNPQPKSLKNIIFEWFKQFVYLNNGSNIIKPWAKAHGFIIFEPLFK